MAHCLRDLDATTFLRMSQRFMTRAPGLASATIVSKFKELFGIHPNFCSELWSLLKEYHPRGGKSQHLLYAVLFLRVYAVEGVNSSICGVDAKTLRKWLWAS